MQGLLKTILSDEALKKLAEPTWWAYPPDGKAAKDQTWSKEASLKLGPIGDYTTKFSFTYKGQEGGKDKIGVKSTLTYSPPADKSGLPFVITKADLSGKDGEGEAIFNRALGRFELSIEVGNMTTEVELNQDQDAVTSTHETNPWDKK
jgi:hypothetical protein